MTEYYVEVEGNFLKVPKWSKSLVRDFCGDWVVFDVPAKDLVWSVDEYQPKINSKYKGRVIRSGQEISFAETKRSRWELDFEEGKELILV